MIGGRLDKLLLRCSEGKAGRGSDCPQDES
jgi:hypothetical protein